MDFNRRAVEIIKYKRRAGVGGVNGSVPRELKGSSAARCTQFGFPFIVKQKISLRAVGSRDKSAAVIDCARD